MVCHKALEALVSVVITGKVGFSAVTPMSSTMNVTAGDTMTLSFLIDKSAIVRNVVGQGIVMDGIAPFPVCTEDFKLSFSSGLRVYLGPPPVALDGTVGDFYFSLMKGRPVNDGAYFSTSSCSSFFLSSVALRLLSSSFLRLYSRYLSRYSL